MGVGTGVAACGGCVMGLIRGLRWAASVMCYRALRSWMRPGQGARCFESGRDVSSRGSRRRAVGRDEQVLGALSSGVSAYTHVLQEVGCIMWNYRGKSYNRSTPHHNLALTTPVSNSPSKLHHHTEQRDQSSPRLFERRKLEEKKILRRPLLSTPSQCWAPFGATLGPAVFLLPDLPFSEAVEASIATWFLSLLQTTHRVSRH